MIVKIAILTCFIVNIQFTYKDWVISFQNSRKYEFEKLDKELIDLYSNKQTIYIVEGEDSYKLNFNLVSYNQEAVILQTLGLVFMDCEQGNSELICKIKKHDLEKGLNKKVYSTKVYFLSDIANLGFSELPLVGDITIIDNITEKVDVFVGITRLLENVAEGSSNIAFETNVTNINKVITGTNNNKVSFINEYGTTEKAGCSLRKYDDHPLFIICYLPNIGKCWLKEIKEEITFNEANIRYNFRIQPFKNEEKIYHSGEDKGSSIRWLYPEILDFTKNDILYVDYNSTSSRYIKGITFNKDKGDLSCEERQNKLLRCKVLKNHFEKTGYYFTRHSNHLDGKSTYYESPPVKVILKGNIYSIPFYYSLLLILIMF